MLHREISGERHLRRGELTQNMPVVCVTGRKPKSEPDAGRERGDERCRNTPPFQWFMSLNRLPSVDKPRSLHEESVDNHLTISEKYSP